MICFSESHHGSWCAEVSFMSLSLHHASVRETHSTNLTHVQGVVCSPIGSGWGPERKRMYNHSLWLFFTSSLMSGVTFSLILLSLFSVRVKRCGGDYYLTLLQLDQNSVFFHGPPSPLTEVVENKICWATK